MSTQAFPISVPAGGVRLVDIAGDRMTVTAMNLPWCTVETEPGGDRVRLRKGHSFKPAQAFTRLVVRNDQIAGATSPLELELQAGFGDLQDRGGEASVGGFRSTSFFGGSSRTLRQVAAKSGAVLWNPGPSLLLVRRLWAMVTDYGGDALVNIGILSDLENWNTVVGPGRSFYLAAPATDSTGFIRQRNPAGAVANFTTILSNEIGWDVQIPDLSFDSPVVIPPGLGLAVYTVNDDQTLVCNFYFEEV